MTSTRDPIIVHISVHSKWFNAARGYSLLIHWLSVDSQQVINRLPAGNERHRYVPFITPFNQHFPMVFLWFSYGFPMRSTQVTALLRASLDAELREERRAKEDRNDVGCLRQVRIFVYMGTNKPKKYKK